MAICGHSTTKTAMAKAISGHSMTSDRAMAMCGHSTTKRNMAMAICGHSTTKSEMPIWPFVAITQQKVPWPCAPKQEND